MAIITQFYSRRIGLQQGQPIRIYGRARLAGRTGKWDIGLLNMQTEAFSELNLPTENYGVYRARRDISNRNPHAGGMATTRLGLDGSSLNITGNWWHEDLRFPLFFSTNAIVEPGSYSFYGVNFNYSMNNANRLRTSVSGGINTFYDGNQISIGLSPTRNQSRYLEISGGIVMNILELPDRDQKEFLNVYRLRTLFALNTQLSLQLLSQYNYQQRRVGTNARFRYHFSEGLNFWIVYSEINNTRLERFTPALPRFESRTLLVKYTYTFF